jgi:phosphoribosylglycinamide formyltransferase-1
MTSESKSIVCLISGRGSNLEAILRAAGDQGWHADGVRAAAVVSNRREARGLEVARVLTAGFVAHYRGRLLNIHPSLLPAFPGLDTHRRALAAGVRLHGATVHFVSDQLDGGPIVAQAAVPVWPDDSEDVLAARVLEQEHLLLPRCIRWILEGRVRLQGDRVVAEGIAPQDLLVFAR